MIYYHCITEESHSTYYCFKTSFCKASLHMLLELADSAVLPYNLERFPKIMQETLEEFDANNVTSLLQKGGVTLQYIKEAVNEFKNSTEEFMKNLQETKNSLDSLSLRIVNDQMMQLERVFNMPTGLPGTIIINLIFDLISFYDEIYFKLCKKYIHMQVGHLLEMPFLPQVNSTHMVELLFLELLIYYMKLMI